MKMKKIGTGLLACTIMIGGTATAFASNRDTRNAAHVNSVRIGTLEKGEAFKMPKGAIMLSKKLSEAKDGNFDVSIKILKDGETSEIPANAVMLNKEIIEETDKDTAGNSRIMIQRDEDGKTINMSKFGNSYISIQRDEDGKMIYISKDAIPMESETLK